MCDWVASAHCPRCTLSLDFNTLARTYPIDAPTCFAEDHRSTCFSILHTHPIPHRPHEPHPTTLTRALHHAPHPTTSTRALHHEPTADRRRDQPRQLGRPSSRLVGGSGRHGNCHLLGVRSVEWRRVCRRSGRDQGQRRSDPHQGQGHPACPRHQVRRLGRGKERGEGKRGREGAWFSASG